MDLHRLCGGFVGRYAGEPGVTPARYVHLYAPTAGAATDTAAELLDASRGELQGWTVDYYTERYGPVPGDAIRV